MKMRANSKVVLNPFLLLCCILNPDEIMEFERKKSTKETFYSALRSVFPSLQYPECSEKLFLLGSFLKTWFLKVCWVSKSKTWARSARIWEKIKRDSGAMNLNSDSSCRR